jgi:hypothetical protein
MGRISARVLVLQVALAACFLFVFSSGSSYASLTSCSASINPQSININSSGNSITFTVYNTGESGDTMSWIQVTPPNGNYSIDGNSFFSFDDVTPGNFVSPTVVVSIGNTPSSSQDWLVQAADNPYGISAINCAGDLGMSAIDASPPQISNVVVSSITNTSAIITWDTSKPAKSELDYGETIDYGFAKTDNNSVTSHSYTLDSLSANTTYHFNIKATDDQGTLELGDNSFVTAAIAGVTQEPITVTVTTTTTTTQLVTPSPTPTPIPDKTAPSIYLSTNFDKPFVQAPQVSGTATDNKAVAKLEYSLDGGHNWLPVDSAPNLGKTSTTFSFLPSSLDDGNYALQVRATDSSGNVGVSKINTLVIDRLPPQASGVLFSLGPQIINPASDGTIVTLSGQKFKITLSDVGGSTQAAILVKTAKGSVKTFNLAKNSDNGLWSTYLTFDEGAYQLAYSAIDGAGNKTTRDLNKVISIAKGVVNSSNGGIQNAKVTVYYQEQITNSWQVWDGAAYSQQNPQITDASGNYSLFLPPGKYYLHIDAFGFKTSDSDIFTIGNSQPIIANFKLSSLKLLFALGPLKLYFPDFSVLSVPFKNNLPQINQAEGSFINTSTPFFNLTVAGQSQLNSDSLTGKPTVITFLNTWSPSSTEQVSILNNFAKNKDFNSVAIIEGEKVSKVYVFQKRGGYGLPIFADPDATLATPYNLSVLPVHYFLDKKGIVKKVIYGALNENELANTLINISQ